MPNGSPVKIQNIEEIQQLVGEELRQVVAGLAQAAAQDIREFAFGIGRNMIEVQQEPDKDKRAAKMAELQAQLKGIAELNRIRMNNAAWASFEKAFEFGARLLDTVLANAVLAI